MKNSVSMGGFDTLFFTKDNYTTFCKKIHQFVQILPRLKPISKAGRGGGKRACQMDGLMETRQSQASRISSGGRPGQALRCPLCRTGDSGVRIAIHGISAAMCAS